MKYTIDEAFVIRVFSKGKDVPFLIQPIYPNGDKFENYQDASAWAKLYIASFREGEPYAPDGKGLKGRAKPILEEIGTVTTPA
jgi:hypothetical protein